MNPLGLSAYRLAKDIGVPVTRVQAIVAERRGITGDTALRLGRYFGTSPNSGSTCSVIMSWRQRRKHGALGCWRRLRPAWGESVFRRAPNSAPAQ
jgi:hypothetical protein